MKFKLGELFCGPGGLAWAAKTSSVPEIPDYSIQHAWATDYDHDTCETYRKNICPKTPESVIREDIRDLDYKCT